jgi:DNA-binding transcriptional regulator YiaG
MMRSPAPVLISGCAKERLALLEGLPPNISDGDKAAALKRFGDEFAHKTAESILSGGSSGGQQDPAVTRLKALRLKNGLSQSALADASGVPVRTIQQYEQRQKDINKAHFEYIIRLAAALNCEPSELFERLNGA